MSLEVEGQLVSEEIQSPSGAWGQGALQGRNPRARNYVEMELREGESLATHLHMKPGNSVGATQAKQPPAFPGRFRHPARRGRLRGGA